VGKFSLESVYVVAHLTCKKRCWVFKLWFSFTFVIVSSAKEVIFLSLSVCWQKKCKKL